MTNKEIALKKIIELVEKFGENVELFKRADYNETQTRIEFINPFFKALGWDLDNEQNLLESYQEVKHEDKIKVNGHKKAPDYSFNLNGKRKFFVEAKKPFVDLKNHPEPALQVRNYGWNGKLLISILTDFEEFCIYDCTKKPKATDKAIKNRLKYLKYNEYVANFDFLYDIFAKENVKLGSIEKYFKQKIDKSKETVDKEFLKSLENWRTYLATSIAIKNSDLDEYEINYSVQQTIDRIVFLKICEDRGIESQGSLKQTIKSGNYYQNLFGQFHIADQKYNSGIFDFQKDKFTQKLEIENKIIRNIINELYESGYDFAIIPIEILGYAYEQFLGKVIRLESSKHAIIEEKPEVRKAGGVYYTPQYIVDYIVSESIGKYIENKTPEEISQLKILDSACGSGSFLIGAYQYLLDWHLRYYNQLKIGNYELGIDMKNNHSKFQTSNLKNILTPDGRLTTSEKKRILLNNIFGVDVDIQAVEVTKLSLLIKCLEGESEASIETNTRLFHDRILPNLDKNILNGNSIINHDFYKDGLFPSLNEMRKINTFNWKEGFKEIITHGGFDFIIGNPPYFSLDIVPNDQKDYIEKKFHFATRQSNIYFFFIAVANQLLKENGVLSFINERYYFSSKNATDFRKFISNSYQISEIIDFKNIQIFEDVNTLTVINTFIKSNIKQTIKVVQFNDELRSLDQYDLHASELKNTFYINQSELLDSNWLFNNPKLNSLESVFKNTKTLDKIVHMGQGITTGLNDTFVVDENTIKKFNLEPDLLKKYVKTRDVKEYEIFHRKLYVILALNETQIDNYPNIKDYLKLKIDLLTKRYEYRKGQSTWFSVSVPRNLSLFQNSTEKIITPLYSKGNKFGIDITDMGCGYYTLTDTYILVKKENVEISLKYLLAILNSQLLNFYNRHFGKLKRDGYYEYSRNTLSKYPIHIPNLNDTEEKTKYEQIIKYVDSIMELKQRYNNSKLPNEKSILQNQINYTETTINQLINELYKVPDEILKMIEK